MNDRAIVTTALDEAALIVGDYLEPGLPRDPVATIKKLIEVLENEELAAAIKRTEKAVPLCVVK